MLVVASYVFYAFWDWRFMFLLGASTLANWAFGLWIDRGEGNRRKHALTVAIVFNLVTLGFFKYFNFFADTFAALLHLDPHALTLRIVLPVGISFFTFEGIAYAVDVYRRDLAARRSALDFALFISFFPHLIAGPIIRPVNFFPQTGSALLLDSSDARWGLREILKGLFKKMALSNFFAPLADAYFHNMPFEGLDVPALIGVFAFSMQIYFDFSGYTDIARGCARLLGYRFPVNFNGPTSAPASANSGGAGTSRCLRGCATTFTYHSAATAKARREPAPTCSSSWVWAGCGTAPAGTLPSGVCTTACC